MTPIHIGRKFMSSGRSERYRCCVVQDDEVHLALIFLTSIDLDAVGLDDMRVAVTADIDEEWMQSHTIQA